MTHESFCYWLQGHFEMNPDSNTLTEDQIIMIKEHLNLVFNKVTGTQLQPSIYPGNGLADKCPQTDFITTVPYTVPYTVTC